MFPSGKFPQLRMRRLRANSAIRRLVRETRVDIDDLVLPLIIRDGSGEKQSISSMPGHYQLTLEQLPEEINELQSLGISSILLFGLTTEKDAIGCSGSDPNGIIQRAIGKIKELVPNMLIISDVCLCEYTDHGHCGAIKQHDHTFEILNDKTLTLIAEQAVSHARAGADVIAPSGMMDGMVGAIRRRLDEEGFEQVPILSYTVKYCSSLYGPFREAAEGAPKFGDRSSYQMDPANAKEAIREATLDLEEGADMLMVKPAHTFLDIIFQIKQQFPSVPLAAYHVSGEFAMIKAAAEKGWIDEKKVMLEVLTSIKRAGTDFIITYFAKDFARLFKK